MSTCTGKAVCHYSVLHIHGWLQRKKLLNEGVLVVQDLFSTCTWLEEGVGWVTPAGENQIKDTCWNGDISCTCI